MSVFKVNIKLQKEEAAFSPGDAVDGFVNVDVVQRGTIRDLCIHLLGVGVLRQLSPSAEESREATAKSEVYVKDERCLYNANDAAIPDLISDAGNHVCFPFTFILPLSIPSSFESEGGYVRYTITATLQGVDLAPVSRTEFISVIALLDLNAITNSVVPVSASVEKRKTKWLCVSERNLHAAVRTHRVGYVPGEVISLNAEIYNLDSKPIKSSRAHLMQIIKYRNKSGSKKLKRLVSEISRGCTLPKDAQHWIEEPLMVPALAPSYLDHCNLIDISYKIYFYVCKPGVPEIVLKLPVIIGNIPLLGLIDAISHDMELSSTQLYKGGARYEDCYFGPYDVTDCDDAQERCMFSPKYIIYGT